MREVNRDCLIYLEMLGGSFWNFQVNIGVGHETSKTKTLDAHLNVGNSVSALHMAGL